MISLSPLSGYKFITPFTISISPSATDAIINWADGTFSSISTASHIYSSSDVYHVFAGNCAATSAFTLSVFNGPFYENRITVTQPSISSIASCPTTFTLYVSSIEEKSTIFLYSSGGNSYPYSEDRHFWSHLNPEWKFANASGDVISQLDITGTAVYDISSNLLGYSAMSSVIYYDDMPGTPNLFFTMVLQNCDVNINSRIYYAFPYTIIPDVPVRLLITADGVNPINGIQWADIENPYVISVQGLCSCGNIMHYASGSVVGSRANQLCFGVDSSDYYFEISSINLTDSDCFNTGGYLMTHFVLPASAIPDNVISNDMNELNCHIKMPDEVRFSITRKSPYVQLSAMAVISVNGNQYTLSGISNPFYIHKFENFHDFYRTGEDRNPYDFIKHYSHFDLETLPKFNAYLSSIAGSGDSLGKVYDKIFNIGRDLSDIDVCTIDSIYDISKKMDIDIDNFSLDYPEELKRLMNFFSIPLEKLIGTRCVCNSQFLCESCCGKNICSLCGFNKKNNLGDQLTFDSYVTAGQTILIREHGSDIYDFLPINQTSLVRHITAVDVNNYCFFKWNDFHQNNPIESVIDFTNPRTILSQGLTAANDWYADNGVVEEMINFTLTKNIL